MIGELWSDEKIALLKELWVLNLTGAKIAEIMAERKMPTPKNAIYKKVQRLGLTPRGSPIVNISSSKSRKSMIQEAKSISSTPATSSFVSSQAFEKSQDYKAPLPSRMAKYDRGEGCCWPIGDPRNDNFHFCGKNRAGRNYCVFHERIAYHRPLELVAK